MLFMKRKMMTILFLFLLLLFSGQIKNSGISSDSQAKKYAGVQNTTFANTVMKIENNQTVLEINLNGGSISDFHLKDLPVNPLSWRNKDTTMPPFMGHFLCFDRWGPPSEGEKLNGFQHHGEVNTITWKVLSEPRINDGKISCSMTCTLPMGGLELTRRIEMPVDGTVAFVREEIKNLNKYGRMFNIVQHVTLGPPFLDKTTLFDNNTEKGFENKGDGSPDQEEPVLRWPRTVHNGKKVSLRHFHDPWPLVSSFVYSPGDKYGWTSASNPGKNLLLGYIWKTEDYPWINFWRSMENDIPLAFGMEFGTTGLHEPFPVVAKKGKIFNRNLYDFIDAGEVILKSYTVFLARIPDDYQGTDKIEITDSSVIVREKKRPSRDIVLTLKNINP